MLTHIPHGNGSKWESEYLQFVNAEKREHQCLLTTSNSKNIPRTDVSDSGNGSNREWRKAQRDSSDLAKHQDISHQRAKVVIPDKFQRHRFHLSRDWRDVIHWHNEWLQRKLHHVQQREPSASSTRTEPRRALLRYLCLVMPRVILSFLYNTHHLEQHTGKILELEHHDS